MLYGVTVPLLCGPYVVRVRDVAGAEEVSESLRHVGAEGEGILSCSFGRLLDF